MSGVGREEQLPVCKGRLHTYRVKPPRKLSLENHSLSPGPAESIRLPDNSDCSWPPLQWSPHWGKLFRGFPRTWEEGVRTSKVPIETGAVAFRSCVVGLWKMARVEVETIFGRLWLLFPRVGINPKNTAVLVRYTFGSAPLYSHTDYRPSCSGQFGQQKDSSVSQLG